MEARIQRISKEKKLNPEQEEEIRLAYHNLLSDDQVGFLLIDDFDAMQMEQIRIAIEDNLEEKYLIEIANKENSVEKMRALRLKYLNEK